MKCWNCERDDKIEYVPNLVHVMVENERKCDKKEGLWRCNRCRVWTGRDGKPYGLVPLARLIIIKKYRNMAPDDLTGVASGLFCRECDKYIRHQRTGDNQFACTVCGNVRRVDQELEGKKGD